MARPKRIIEVGKTYANKGLGLTRRTVIRVGEQTEEYKAPWFSSNKRPDEHVVTFTQKGRSGKQSLYLRSFIAWAGKEV